MNGVAGETTSHLNSGGSIVRGDEVLEAWAKHFKVLATPSDNNYNAGLEQKIKRQYELINNIPLSEFDPFTEEEVADTVASLKLNKAAGPDHIDPEHLRYGGSVLCAILTLIFNAIILSGHIPSAFCNGLVTPIPKGHNKDLSQPNNYRGITVLSNVSKVLEKLVLLRISMLDPIPTLNPLQGGFRPGHSCIHSAFVLQEGLCCLSGCQEGFRHCLAYRPLSEAPSEGNNRPYLAPH